MVCLSSQRWRVVRIEPTEYGIVNYDSNRTTGEQCPSSTARQGAADRIEPGRRNQITAVLMKWLDRFNRCLSVGSRLDRARQRWM